ncbi:putative phage abortive infection protein [Bacillus halotolerans]|uniref:putative phage abortive infection protein n=1 Tax=Bacillus halotolerans TaxID=260554 RepID=UPI001BFFFC80|nr:putative phage abortive infection protein [Bacillus halotolerans]MBT9250399.1 putative phage abortive infection protein [Bacillus halotolerans]
MEELKEKEEEKEEEIEEKENKWIWIGGIIAFVAIITPILLFVLNYFFCLEETIGALGTVGDFLGGSTVGLFSLSSIIFVVAAIVMQKEELSMQRRELTMQRTELKRTRKEFELSNKTLKKQQFETTFFNMINLQHNILKEIKILDGDNIFTGRDAIEAIFKDIKDEYYKFNRELYIKYAISDLIGNDLTKLYNITKKIYLAKEKINFLNNRFEAAWEEIYEEIKKNVQNETDNEWLELKDQLLLDFKEYENNPENCLEYLSETYGMVDMYLRTVKSEENITYDIYLDFETADFLVEVDKKFNKCPNIKLKYKVYETIYRRNEKVIGHYFRNLYRIVKFIEEQRFDEDIVENEKEKRNYRGILRAQLSSIELLMIFYNIVYSEKGGKFAELIFNKNFFDDHLVHSQFIWENDIVELNRLN